MKIGEVCLQTNDVNRLADFYKMLLGIQGDSDDPVHQVLISEEPTLTIYNDGSAKEPANNNISLAFTVDNVDAEYQRLLSMGVTVIEVPTTRQWGARNMHFLDPDGNHVYFRSFPQT